MATISIPRRFCGPTGTANGGYTCGVIAAAAGRPCTVRLLRPVPLETPLELVERDGVLAVLHGGERIAEARPGEVGALAVPPPPSLAAARDSSRRYAGFDRHPAPECFVCGPTRAEGDALRIFAGRLDGADAAPSPVAAPWTPDPSLDAGDGLVRSEFMWAALDCPGFAAAAPDMRAMLLGELTARIDRRARIGETCIVVGWEIAASGRKHEAGTAIFDADGTLCAVGRAIWIEPRPVSQAQ